MSDDVVQFEPYINKKKPIIKNSDGTVSTEKTITIEQDGQYLNVPTIISGKEVSKEEAVLHANKTGENTGVYNTLQDAEGAAQARSDEIGKNLEGGQVVKFEPYTKRKKKAIANIPPRPVANAPKKEDAGFFKNVITSIGQGIEKADRSETDRFMEEISAGRIGKPEIDKLLEEFKTSEIGSELAFGLGAPVTRTDPTWVQKNEVAKKLPLAALYIGPIVAASVLTVPALGVGAVGLAATAGTQILVNAAAFASFEYLHVIVNGGTHDEAVEAAKAVAKISSVVDVAGTIGGAGMRGTASLLKKMATGVVTKRSLQRISLAAEVYLKKLGVRRTKEGLKHGSEAKKQQRMIDIAKRKIEKEIGKFNRFKEAAQERYGKKIAGIRGTFKKQDYVDMAQTVKGAEDAIDAGFKAQYNTVLQKGLDTKTKMNITDEVVQLFGSLNLKSPKGMTDSNKLIKIINTMGESATGKDKATQQKLIESIAEKGMTIANVHSLKQYVYKTIKGYKNTSYADELVGRLYSVYHALDNKLDLAIKQVNPSAAITYKAIGKNYKEYMQLENKLAKEFGSPYSLTSIPGARENVVKGYMDAIEGTAKGIDPMNDIVNRGVAEVLQGKVSALDSLYKLTKKVGGDDAADNLYRYIAKASGMAYDARSAKKVLDGAIKEAKTSKEFGTEMLEGGLQRLNKEISKLEAQHVKEVNKITSRKLSIDQTKIRIAKIANKYQISPLETGISVLGLSVVLGGFDSIVPAVDNYKLKGLVALYGLYRWTPVASATILDIAKPLVKNLKKVVLPKMEKEVGRAALVRVLDFIIKEIEGGK